MRLNRLLDKIPMHMSPFRGGSCNRHTMSGSEKTPQSCQVLVFQGPISV